MGLKDALFVLPEFAESCSAFLTPTLCALLNKHSDRLESLHISDQYTGFVTDRCVLVYCNLLALDSLPLQR